MKSMFLRVWSVDVHTTGKSTTLSKRRQQLQTSTVFCTVTTRTLSAQQRACQQPSPGTGHHEEARTATAETPQFFCPTWTTHLSLDNNVRVKPKNSTYELDLRHPPTVQRGLLELARPAWAQGRPQPKEQAHHEALLPQPPPAASQPLPAITACTYEGTLRDAAFER